MIKPNISVTEPELLQKIKEDPAVFIVGAVDSLIAFFSTRREQ